MLYEDHEWVYRYRPPCLSVWKGREDGPRFHHQVVCDDLRQPLEIVMPTFAFLGFACDEGVRRNKGRVGASFGPQEVRQALAKLPIRRTEEWKFYDVGDITCDDGDLESAQRCLGKTVAWLVESGVQPLVIGGGHELAFGHYLGLSNSYPDLSVVNLDAYFDLRIEEESNSGTSFYQIRNACKEKNIPFRYAAIGVQPTSVTDAWVRTAEKEQVAIGWASDFEDKGGEKISFLLNQIVAEQKPIYLSVSLDVFATPFAPGVSSPQALGITPQQGIRVIRHLALSGLLRGFDIAELSPPLDEEGKTASLAAHLLATTIYHQLCQTS